MDAQRTAPDLSRLRVPKPLRERPLWLVWRYEQFEGEPRPRKVPLYANGGKRHGRQGSDKDRAALVKFDNALAAAKQRGMDGVGLALLPGEQLVALDFDRCVDDAQVDDRVLDLVQGTYAELSPSGSGVRAIFASEPIGNHKSRATSEQFGAEVFSTSGFVTFTGNALDHVDLLGLEDRVAPLPERVRTFCQQRFGRSESATISDDFTAGFEPVLDLSETEIRDTLDALDPDMDRDGWIRCGMGLHHQYSGEEDGFALWDEWSAQGSKYPGEEALRQQWDSFTRRQGPGRKQVTMASVLAMARDAKADDERRVATVAEAQAKADALTAELPKASGVATPEGFEGKFKVQSAASIAARKPLNWIVKNVIPEADLGVIYGPSGSGKSFVSLDLAMCIARGVPWRGHKVKQGKVVIIAAEGGGGYGKRIQAYCQHHDIDPATLNLGIIDDAPNIREADDVGELAASIKALGDVVAVFIDTFAQVTPGANENASEDMGKALANLMTLKRVTGAMQIPIHHSGKDLSRGQRGWSGLKGAMDFEIEVSRDEDTDTREIRLSKMKDEEDGLRFGFRLENVVLGMDEDGDEYRSCVAVEAELARKREPSGAGKTKRRDVWQMAVLDAIAIGPVRDGMSSAELIQLTIDSTALPEGEGRDTRQANLNRAIRALGKEPNGPIGLVGNNVIFYE